MKTYEIRSLLNDEQKIINISPEIKNVFEVWLKKRKNINVSIEPVEIFYAGYVLSNPNVKDKYLRELKN